MRYIIIKYRKLKNQTQRPDPGPEPDTGSDPGRDTGINSEPQSVFDFDRGFDLEFESKQEYENSHNSGFGHIFKSVQVSLRYIIVTEKCII